MFINKRNKRPLVFVANSSWYLLHYRSGLIKECSKGSNVITISPIDQSTEYLSNISLHFAWKMSRKNSLNPIEIIMEFLRMFLMLRTIKPKIVHSHTLKANLIVTICCSLLGLPCVLSFAGLGRLINTKKNFFLYSILRFIYFFGNIERVGFFSFAFNNKRTQYNR